MNSKIVTKRHWSTGAVCPVFDASSSASYLLKSWSHEQGNGARANCWGDSGSGATLWM